MEPRPAAAMAESDPAAFAKLGAEPGFIAFRYAKAPAAATSSKSAPAR